MAFYKDYTKDKKKDHAAQGSWDDEGAHYKTPAKAVYVQRTGKPASVRTGKRPEGSAPAGAAPAYRARPEGAQGERKPYGRPAPRSDYRPAAQKPAYRARPENGEGEKRVFGHPAPRSDFRPAGDRPAYRARPDSAQGERKPYGRSAPKGDFRPAGDRPAYRARPENGEGEKRVYGHPAPRSDFRSTVDRPAFRARTENADGGKRAYGRPAPVRERENQEPAYKRHEYKPAVISPAPKPAVEEAIDPNENLLSGRNPIREAIKSGRDIEKLLVAKGDLSGSAREIIAMAREARIPVQEVERVRLDEITKNHQGMLAFASAYQYATVEDMLAQAKAQGEEPFLILLDGITDPHNLGAVIRTAECVGAHGVIVPERRSVGLTPAAVKASAGAVEHVKVARVGNLTRVLQDLQKAGLWITAATTDGEDYRKADMKGPLALVIGSEGEGISRLVQEHCDRTVSLPLKGQIGSLNASVAAGILMYAVMAARNV